MIPSSQTGLEAGGGLRIKLLGPPSITNAGASLTLPARADTRGLLLLLLLEPEVFHPRQFVAHRLWPDQTEARAQTRLRRAIHRLARHLVDWPAHARTRLHRDRRYLSLALPADSVVDLLEYERLEREIERLPLGADRTAPLLRQALALHSGRLLEGQDGRWLDDLRRDLMRRKLRDQQSLSRVRGLPSRPKERAREAEPRASARLSSAARRAWANATIPYVEEPAIGRLAEILADMPAALDMAGAAMGTIPSRRIPELLGLGIEHLVSLQRDSALVGATLWQQIDHRFRDLGELEQGVLERLSLLSGTFVAGTALSLVEDPQGAPNGNARSGAAVTDSVLESLLDRGSLRPDPSTADEQWERDGLLALRQPLVFRQFHRRCLEARSSDLRSAKTAQRDHYLRLVRSAGQESDTEAQARWMRTLQIERENIDAAMQDIRASGSADEALAFCSAVWVYWYVGGCGEAERDWIRSVVDAGFRNDVGDRRRLASAAHGLGVLLYGEGEVHAAADYLERSAGLYRDAGAVRARASVLQHLALVLSTQGELTKARRCRTESDTLTGEASAGQEASILRNGLTRGHIERSAGRLRAAYSLFRHSDRAFQRAQRPDQQRMHALTAAGETALDLGLSKRAEDHLRQALAIAEEIGSRANISTILDSLGRLYSRQGRRVEARQALIRSLLIARELSEQSGVIISLCNLAELELGDLDIDKASFLLREAERLARRIDDREGMVYVALLVAECGVGAGDRRLLDRAAALLRSSGGGEAFIGSAANAARLRTLAWIACWSGNGEQASEHWLTSAGEHLARCDAYETMRGIERMAVFLEIAVERGAGQSAWALASRIRNAIGTPRMRFEARGFARAGAFEITEDDGGVERVADTAGDGLRVEVETLLREAEARFQSLTLNETGIEDWIARLADEGA